MKKNWLKGVLLGVSVALLLAGGVALANGVFIEANKQCITCYDYAAGPGPENIVTLSFGGWEADDYLCIRWRIGSFVFIYNCHTQETAVTRVTEDFYFPCEVPEDAQPFSVLGEGLVPSDMPDSFLGEHTVRLWLEEPVGTVVDSDNASFLVARVCEEDFVPEPGTILLLGSGLAGLAGYASLRWRSKE